MEQVHPTGFVDPAQPDAPVKILAPESLTAHGGVLVDPGTSKCFVNELETRLVVSAAIFQATVPRPLLIMSHAVVRHVGEQAIEFYRSHGLIKVYHGLDAMARAKNLEYGVVKKEFHPFHESDVLCE
ncbi:hypothetical protein HK102_001436 [Quaeritorhiza haematococci]|nr:hypothetical protein HK102_001436 [Quaeritorhiza haematococci]